jgi:hypothetical protein
MPQTGGAMKWREFVNSVEQQLKALDYDPELTEVAWIDVSWLPVVVYRDEEDASVSIADV